MSGYDDKYSQGSSTEAELLTMTDNISRPGITREEVMKTYELWAPNYEKDMHSVTFKAPSYVSQEADKLLQDKKTARILDACAGTGRVAQDLVKAGFVEIDALDGSAKMLEEAKKLGIYKNFYLELLGPNKLVLPDNVYDAVVTTGSFVPGHCREDCYDEIIRILKPGGYFILVMCEKHFFTDPEWTKNIEPRMLELQTEGKWTRITRKKIKDYMYEDIYDGIVFVLQKN